MKQKVKTKLQKQLKSKKIEFKYINVIQSEFIKYVRKGIELGLVKKGTGGFMQCCFWYGDARIFTKKPYIIGMVNYDDEDCPTEHYITKEYKNYIEPIINA